MASPKENKEWKAIETGKGAFPLALLAFIGVWYTAHPAKLFGAVRTMVRNRLDMTLAERPLDVLASFYVVPCKWGEIVARKPVADGGFAYYANRNQRYVEEVGGFSYIPRNPEDRHDMAEVDALCSWFSDFPHCTTAVDLVYDVDGKKRPTKAKK